MRQHLNRALSVGAATAGMILGTAGLSVTGVAGADNVELDGQAWTGGKPAANVVVLLDAPNAPRTPQRDKIVMDQRNLRFYPHVLAVRVGTTVDFPNHDRVFHNVFSFRDGKRFDLGLYPVGAVREVTFGKPGLSRLFCSIHPEMSAYIVAVDTPYFDVSDEKGSFSLPGVPARAYTYHAWRPGAAALSGSIVVRPAARLEIRWP